jgi:hypothetical protein
VSLATSAYTVDGVACVADPATLTLSPGVAEVHKSNPAVFRWGLGVHWTLACDDGSTRVMPALFDTMFVNPPTVGCSGDYDAGQVVSPASLRGAYTKDCGTAGSVRATWDLACAENQVCASGECTTGLTACSGAVQSCVGATPVPDGTPCSLGSCSAGVCLP